MLSDRRWKRFMSSPWGSGGTGPQVISTGAATRGSKRPSGDPARHEDRQAYLLSIGAGETRALLAGTSRRPVGPGTRRRRGPPPPGRFPVPQPLVSALARAVEAAVLLGRPDDARPLIVELVDTLPPAWSSPAGWPRPMSSPAIVLGERPARHRPPSPLGAADCLPHGAGVNSPGPAFLLAGALEAAIDQIPRAPWGQSSFSSQRKSERGAKPARRTRHSPLVAAPTPQKRARANSAAVVGVERNSIHVEKVSPGSRDL